MDEALSSNKRWGEKFHGTAVAFKTPQPMELPPMGENVGTDLFCLGQEGMMQGRNKEGKA